MPSSKKNKKKNAKKFFVLPNTLFKKKYIEKKKNEKVLFVYDGENIPNGTRADFLNLENTLKLDFLTIDDNDLEDSKRKIKTQMAILKEAVKKHKEIVVPEIPLGQKLITRPRSAANKSFQFLTNQLKKYEMTTSVEIKKLKLKSKKKKRTLENEPLNNENTSKSKFGMFKILQTSKKNPDKKKSHLKKTAAQIAKEETAASGVIKRLLKDTHSVCQNCEILYDKTRAKELYTEVSNNSKNFIKTVEKGVGLCNSCMKQCKQITENMSKIKTPKRKLKFELRFPKSCRIDHTAQSKALRIKKELDDTLISQHKLINY